MNRSHGIVAVAWIALSLLAVGAAAEPAALQPGTYLTEHGSGTLSINGQAGAAQDFGIDYIGSNLHTCQLDGDVRELVAHPDTGDAQQRCTVRFRPDAGGVTVDVDAATEDACRQFCGARAWFPGRYLLAPAPCTDAARAKSRAGFAAAYKARDYARALAVLEPVLQACERFLRAPDDGGLRNDLAITLFHLGRAADCRTMLAPLMARYPHTEAELREAVPAPGDFEDILPVAKAAWHNDQLCTRR